MHTLASDLFCDSCADIILKAYLFVQNIQNINRVFNKCIDILLEKTYSQNGSDKLKLDICIKDLIGDENNKKKKFILKYDAEKSDTDFDNNDEVPLITLKNKMNSKYECPYCEVDCNNFNKWKQHSEKHRKDSFYKCKYCRMNFKEITKLIEHRQNIHCHNVTYCNICKVILDKKKKKRHYLQHHKDDKLICNFCSKTFYNRFFIKQHLRLHHSDLINFTSNLHSQRQRCIYKCVECNTYPCAHEKYINSYIEQRNLNKTPLKCIDCNFIYKYKTQIIAHSNKQHLNLYPHLCDLCGQRFVSKDVLNYHSNKHKMLFHCSYCNKQFKDQNSLNSHIPLCQTTERNYQCDLCNINFTTQEKVVFHRRKHFSKNFACKFCPKKYWTKSELNLHSKRLHSDKLEEIPIRIYQCSMCELNFNSKKCLKQHTVSHDDNSMHICRLCSATFKSKINYYGHIRRHKIKKDKECPVCLKLYDKYHIRNHIKSHETKRAEPVKIEKKLNKNTMCEICGRFLLNAKSLIKHREIHKEQQQCPQCLKFINSITFDKHLRKHSLPIELCIKRKRQRRKYNCNKCDYTTSFNECLEAHINRFHLQIRPFACDICKKGFYAKLTLKEHIKIHSGLKPEQCHECGNRFVNKKALKMHVRIHSGEKPYPCDLCNEKFLSASRRQAHRIRKHFEPSVQCPVCLKMYYTQSAVRLHLRDCHSNEPPSRCKKK